MKHVNVFSIVAIIVIGIVAAAAPTPQPYSGDPALAWATRRSCARATSNAVARNPHLQAMTLCDSGKVFVSTFNRVHEQPGKDATVLRAFDSVTGAALFTVDGPVKHWDKNVLTYPQSLACAKKSKLLFSHEMNTSSVTNCVGVCSGETMTAFDQHTGRVVWHSPVIATGTSFGTSTCEIFVSQAHGVAFSLFPLVQHVGIKYVTSARLIAFDVATGAQLWSHAVDFTNLYAPFLPQLSKDGGTAVLLNAPAQVVPYHLVLLNVSTGNVTANLTLPVHLPNAWAGSSGSNGYSKRVTVLGGDYDHAVLTLPYWDSSSGVAILSSKVVVVDLNASRVVQKIVVVNEFAIATCSRVDDVEILSDDSSSSSSSSSSNTFLAIRYCAGNISAFNATGAHLWTTSFELGRAGVIPGGDASTTTNASTCRASGLHIVCQIQLTSSNYGFLQRVQYLIFDARTGERLWSYSYFTSAGNTTWANGGHVESSPSFATHFVSSALNDSTIYDCRLLSTRVVAGDVYANEYSFQVEALSPCGAFVGKNATCPAVCGGGGGGGGGPLSKCAAAGCESLNATYCGPTAHVSRGACKLCSAMGRCMPAAADCKCASLTKASCYMPASNGTCFFCDGNQRCLDRTTALASCPGQCRNLPLQACTEAGTDGVACATCPTIDACRNADGGGVCDCGVLSETACRISDACTWFLPPLNAQVSTHGVCTPNTECAPVTCESISQPVVCTAAGCTLSTSITGGCQGGDCFSFFLPRFISMPFALLFAGIAKDVVVLLLIGVVGDVIARRIARSTVPVKMWWKGRSATPVHLDATVYINDIPCRDATDDAAAGDADDEKAAAVKRMSYSMYCDIVSTACFELPHDAGDDGGAAAAAAENYGAAGGGGIENSSFDAIDSSEAKYRHKLTDAVAFVLMNTQSWISLATLVDQQLHAREKMLMMSRSDVRSNASSSVSMQEESGLLPRGGGGGASSSSKARLRLMPGDFSSPFALQEKVERVIVERATSIVYYTRSRSHYTSATLAMNSFPSSLQLVFYSASIAVMIASALYTVALPMNTSRIQRIAMACRGHLAPDAPLPNITMPPPLPPQTTTTTTTTTTTVQPPLELLGLGIDLGAASSSSSTPFRDNGGSVVSTVTFFLLCWRFVNSSALATAMLILVKLLRGLWSAYVGGLETLTLQQRLPIMQFLSSRMIQLQLALYFLMVLPFSLTGFYGIFSGFATAPTLASLGVGTACLLAIAGALALFRFVARRKYRKYGIDGSGGTEAQQNELGEAIQRNDDDAEQQQDDDGLPTATLANFFDVEKHRRDELRHQQQQAPPDNSINSAAPTTIFRAFLVFLLTEDLPCLVLTLMLQTMSNYTSMLSWNEEFALHDSMAAVSRDYGARSVSCVVQLLEGDISSQVSDLTSFLPFM